MFRVSNKPDFTKWEPEENYYDLTPDEQKIWNELTEIYVDMYWDFYNNGIIQIQDEILRTPQDRKSNESFLNILNHQNKLQNAANMWIQISMDVTATKFCKRNPELDLESFTYTYLLLFTGSILQSTEEFRITLVKTLNQHAIKSQLGKKGKKLGQKGLPRLFQLLKDHSPKVMLVKEIIDQSNDMRNAFAHGMWWVQDRKIVIIKNILEPKKTVFSLQEVVEEVRRTSLITQCLIWVTANLGKEGLFRRL